jgi:4-alpha-glucanotransferase
MKFPQIDHFLTGTAIPVFSLRTEKSCGTGEFEDLAVLGEWCSRVNLDLINILPVNDTGYNSSPYSALSAFALNPLYIRLQNVKGAHNYSNEIETFKSQAEANARVEYRKVLDFKLNILSKIFANNKNEIVNDSEILDWYKRREWIPSYALFKLFKKIFNDSSWNEWNERFKRGDINNEFLNNLELMKQGRGGELEEILLNPTESKVGSFFEANLSDVFFYVWIQFNLEKQLRNTASRLEEIKVFLKGDLPIMMEEDSVDIWMNPELFILSMRAGAPPDMYSAEGQNWGFPIYNWPVHEKDNLKWWTNRLKYADKFYHAYRIDHVLGFFRIWAIQNSEISGLYGRYHPSKLITRKELINSGFNDACIHYMSIIRIHGYRLRELPQNLANQIIQKYLVRVENSDQYEFNSKITDGKSIVNLDESEEIKGILFSLYRDRCLFPVDQAGSEVQYSSLWYFYKSSTYKSLQDWEKGKLEKIVSNMFHRNDEVHKKQGMRLLKFLKNASAMLICAEDLGAVPKYVGPVLSQLGILCLKVERWCREWEREGEPFIPAEQFSRLSVCTTSVHDSSNLREWWGEDPEVSRLFFKELKYSGACSDNPAPELMQAILERNLSSNSILCIIPLQDLLSIDGRMHDFKPAEERINTPGSISEKNWSFRIKRDLKSLLSEDEFNARLSKIISNRRARSL